MRFLYGLMSGVTKTRLSMTGLAEGQHVVQLGIALDDPDAKDLADVEQRVSVAVLLLQLGDLLRVADAARDDAVNQRAAEGAVLVDVLL